ncbi:MAG TPA: fused MFS/spermidine synthase [Blastocatellia bacterium]|nr:fused MFS/spermidine synthase [Blastocatellia bacterium]
MATLTAAHRTDRRTTIWAIWLCFFASGMSGLIYQVVWVRELVLVFGATTFAVSTVLTAFMGGLALGSYYFGRRAQRFRDPLKVYGALEIGIGAYGILVPLIFAALPIIYQPFWERLHVSFLALSVTRFVFAALVLILPTALMGATLPVLSNYYARERDRIGLRVGSLYSLNTFGAVLGASVTGFILIPVLGMRASTVVAASINILLGVVALTVSRLEEAAPAGRLDAAAGGPAPEGPRKKGRDRKAGKAARLTRAGVETSEGLGRAEIVATLAAFGLSGFIALSYEVIWSRVLALIIGSSVYAFSIMLTTFLIGLAVGASFASRVVDRIGKPLFAFALIEVGVGASSLLGAYVFNDLPYIFVQVYRWIDPSDFSVLLLVRFLIAALVMIVPTLLLGALFPLVVRIISVGANDRSTGQTVGDAYAANTLGSIVGSFASGFILIPWLGLLDSLRICIALNFVVAAALFFVSLRSAGRARPAAGPSGFPRYRVAGMVLSAAFMAGIILFEPPWDSDVMSSAVYRYAPSLSNLSQKEFHDYLKHGQGETIFYKEGITATIAVQEQSGARVLKANGKPEASTTGDMPTQILIGTLPLLVREQTDDVLVIGLGSGITLGAVQQFPVKRVTCVELEPAIVEASHFFDQFNNRPLEDPRLRLLSNDGRNFIFTTDEKFDVIISEPSNPWLTGVANLFTLEYFKRGADRLRDDGVFSQWLQIYEMSPQDVKTLVATFKTAFPYVYLFRGAEGDLMLLGSKVERKLELKNIQSHLMNPKVASDHRRISADSPADIISRLYLGPKELAAFSDGAPINTDNNALIEFNAPRRVGTAEETVERNVKTLLEYASSPSAHIAENDSVSGYANYALLPSLDGKSRVSGEADFLLETALGAVKRSDYARAEQLLNYSLDIEETARARSVMGELKLAQKDEGAAVEEWNRALAMDPDHFFTLVNLGKHYLMNQDAARAAPYLDRALASEPESARAHHLRGLAYQAVGDNARAASEYRKALPDAEYTRGVKTFYLNFGMALRTLGLYEEAAQMLEEYARVAPEDFDAHFQLGAVYQIISERSLDDRLAERAVSSLRRALAMRQSHAMAHYHLSKAYRQLEMYEQAEAEFKWYERLTP